MDIVNRMEDWPVPRFCISRNGPAGHPVVAVKDQSAFILCTDCRDHMIDDLPLELHCIEKDISPISTLQIVKKGRGDQVYPRRIGPVTEIAPRVFIHAVFFHAGFCLEPSFQIESRQVAFNSFFRKSFTQSRHNFTEPPALTRDEASQIAHALR